MSHTYTPVAADAPESDGNRGADTEDKGAPRPTSTKNWLSARSCLIGSLVACTITGMSVLTARPWSDNASRAQVLGCGNSSAEASAAGCRFDIMSFAWSQPPCFDEELMDDFLGRGDWAWWLDPRGKRPVLWADAAEGRHSELYVTWEYHLLHCTYSQFGLGSRFSCSSARQLLTLRTLQCGGRCTGRC